MGITLGVMFKVECLCTFNDKTPVRELRDHSRSGQDTDTLHTGPLCYQVILVLKSVDRYEITNASVMVQIVSHVLAYMNSCVNPILYAFLSENFRKAFRKVSTKLFYFILSNLYCIL